MVDLSSLDAYDFSLPNELIAQRPVEPRDASRLLVVNRATGTWEHKAFTDLPAYFGANDLFVANNARVLKARLLGKRLLENGELGGKIEFLMLEEHRPLVWEGAFHASAKHKPGVRFLIATPDGKGLIGKLIQGASDSPHGTVMAEFDRDPVESGAGVMPLPPYIERASEAADESRYQTVYASREGSAAAPTAGFHFTDRIMGELRNRGVAWEEVTLHVGLGTFRPVKAENILEHVMHEERYELSEQTAERILALKKSGKRLTAVGTTTVRTLESAWTPEGTLKTGMHRTALFIRPGAHEFHLVDRLITNFHLPKSTLLMLVCALAGRDLILAAYNDAVEKKYRFFSYGDAMLVL